MSFAELLMIAAVMIACLLMLGCIALCINDEIWLRRADRVWEFAGARKIKR